MQFPSRKLLLAGSLTLAFALAASAQDGAQPIPAGNPPGPPGNQQELTAAQSKALIKIRRQRVDLLRGEIKRTDARIESRLEVIIGALETISDSKDSRTKVARMKEETGKKLMKAIRVYDQKRAALKEEIRSPRLRISRAEKERMIAVLDARIAKRTDQILGLYKSMPAFKDEERYTVVGGESRRTLRGDSWDEDYVRNEAYQQNRRMTSHSSTQRDAILKQLDASLARLDRQERSLKSQLAATANPQQRQALSAEIGKTGALIAERRRQRDETIESAGSATREVSSKEAADLDKALQEAANELSKDFATLFQRYNTFLNELSLLHSAEASLTAQNAN